jgi:hypothetical protein
MTRERNSPQSERTQFEAPYVFIVAIIFTRAILVLWFGKTFFYKNTIDIVMYYKLHYNLYK